MKLMIVAAVSDNRVIGMKDDLLWHMPADLAFFTKTIKNKWILVGRKSFESPQGKQLYFGRGKVIVVTRNHDYHSPHTTVAYGVDEALKMGEKLGVEELYILGGSEIYKQSIDKADELIITEIHYEFDGDAFFPIIDSQVWEEYERMIFQPDLENPYPYSFVRYRRRLSRNKKHH